MDCNQAGLAMMEHMEKTIQPASARDLAQHVMHCESCREYYIGIDMALDVLSEEELSVPPVHFTQNIMAHVRRLPVHTPPQPSATPAIRILWGLGAIVLGVALLFAFNPEWWQALTAASPVLDAILSAMATARLFLADALENFTTSQQGASGIAGLPLFNISIIIAFVVGALLLVLQYSEKSHKA
ncbi:MAG: hypothetical protein FWC92_03705 [Defluviitaleaceae bacterium]|nr:hypothetical protein [Defluviitaleaceae bacterium]